MIRILFIIDGLKPGGKERQLVEIIKVLSQNKNYCIGVITFNKNQHYSSFIKENTDFFSELNKKLNPFLPFISIWKPINDFKPNIIHTWDSLSSLYSFLPCRSLGIKFVDGSIRDAGVDKSWHKQLKLFFLKRTDSIIANSKAGLKAYHVTGNIIYNAIDINRFIVPESNQYFSIIMTANFTDYKDHETFISAAIQLLNEQVVDHVYLLGDGPYKQKYIALLENNHPKIADKFSFPGAVYDVEKYLAKCKIGVLCSTPEYSEGLSNSVLEYMAAGLLPIVTDLGGSSEIIENQRNGFLIKPKGKQEIVEIVKKMKHNRPLLEEYIEQAKKTIHNKFASKSNISHLETIYDKLLNND